MTKNCSNCKLDKCINEYSKDKYSKDGLSYRCKSCRKILFDKQNKRKYSDKIKFICEFCKEEKEISKYVFENKKTNFCQKCISQATQDGIKRPQFSREKSARWNGGEYISSDGYKMVKCEGEYTESGRQLYKKEHIIIYEQHIGRKLKTKKPYKNSGDGEQIHHIDGNKINNNIDNLILCDNTKEHREIENQLLEIGYKLYRSGYIVFDKNNKKYMINYEGLL